MKFKLLSDLHFEYNKYFQKQIPHDVTDADTILLLAGDIFPIAHWRMPSDLRNYVYQWFEDVNSRFKHVIYVPGNHEYWGSDISDLHYLQRILQPLKNVSVLNNQHIIFDDVAIIGATLWTNYFNETPMVMFNCQQKMFDSRHISNINGPQYHNSSKVPMVISSDLLELHKESYSYIFNTIENMSQQNLKTVVVTHHGPTALSIDKRYENHICNGGYISDFTEEFLDNKGPNFWCHGHVHSSNNYSFGRTTVLTNPYGVGFENQEVNRDEDELFFRYDFSFEV